MAYEVRVLGHDHNQLIDSRTGKVLEESTHLNYLTDLCNSLNESAAKRTSQYTPIVVDNPLGAD